MQVRFNKHENAYLTVYLSLVFGIILSLLLALIEGAAAGAARAQSELVADLGMDSVFAEYNREVLNQYELFFIDTSYGGGDGGIGRVEQHLNDYMSQNLTPEKDLDFIGATTFLKLNNPYLEIEEVSYASDENGAVWKAQAIDYMKATYGGDLISTVKQHLDTVNGNELGTRNIAGELKQQKQEFEELLSDTEITEYNSESEEGYSYDKLSDIFDSMVGNGMLGLVMPEGSTISGATIDKSQYLSSRAESGQVNKGIGLHEGIEYPNGIDDELIYGEYLMKVCGNYSNVKENGLLDYQIEYILCGKDNDVSNLRECAEKLIELRSVSNIIYLLQDDTKKNEAKAVAVIICTLLTIPEASDVLTYIIMGIWALAEAVVDVRGLFDGGKVPLLKEKGDWNLGIMDMLNTNLSGSKERSKGLSYEDYMRIFLALMDSDDKVLRSLDIVEMDIRQTQGNERFRVDRCIDYMRVSFGFDDAQGHEFVFSKKMCYE